MTGSERYIWVNGDLIPDYQPVFRAESKGWMYGAGAFETFRTYSGRMLHEERHLERLNRGLAWLGADRTDFICPGFLSQTLPELLGRNRLANREALVRMQASLSGSRGYQQAPGEGVDILVTADTIPKTKDEYRLTQVGTTAVPSSSRPASLKLTNTVHYMAAWREARTREFDDALMLTSDGYIAETSIANLFWKAGDVIYTPGESCDILPGITRQVVLDLLTARGVHVEKGDYRPEALQEAELVWMSNSVRRIQPVTGIDDQFYPLDDPFYRVLENDFLSYIEQNLL